MRVNVLSLFDGISCGRVALDRAGISVNKYYSSEIDKYAIRVSQNNYPDIIRLGDINNWESWDIDFSSIDLILAGSPCQDLSWANKDRMGLMGTKSSLFFRFAEILETARSVNPDLKFLLENVSMKTEYQHTISAVLGCKPVTINSELLSGQLRKRLYWANFDINQPGDKKISLQSILSKGVTNRTKSRALLASDSRPLVNKHNMLHRYLRAGFTTIVFKDQKTMERLTSKYVKKAPFREKKHLVKIHDDDIRVLDQFELEALQTLPQGYTQVLNRNQAAHVIGNAWTVDVIAHILKSLSL